MVRGIMMGAECGSERSDSFRSVGPASDAFPQPWFSWAGCSSKRKNYRSRAGNGLRNGLGSLTHMFGKRDLSARAFAFYVDDYGRRSRLLFERVVEGRLVERGVVCSTILGGPEARLGSSARMPFRETSGKAIGGRQFRPGLPFFQFLGTRLSAGKFGRGPAAESSAVLCWREGIEKRSEGPSQILERMCWSFATALAPESTQSGAQEGDGGG